MVIFLIAYIKDGDSTAKGGVVLSRREDILLFSILFPFVNFLLQKEEETLLGRGRVTERRKFCFLCSVNVAARQGKSMEMKNFVF